MKLVNATASVVPKNFIFTFMGDLQLLILIHNKGKYWNGGSSIFWPTVRINGLENVCSLETKCQWHKISKKQDAV